MRNPIQISTTILILRWCILTIHHYLDQRIYVPDDHSWARRMHVEQVCLVLAAQVPADMFEAGKLWCCAFVAGRLMLWRVDWCQVPYPADPDVQPVRMVVNGIVGGIGGSTPIGALFPSRAKLCQVVPNCVLVLRSIFKTAPVISCLQPFLSIDWPSTSRVTINLPRIQILQQHGACSDQCFSIFGWLQRNIVTGSWFGLSDSSFWFCWQLGPQTFECWGLWSSPTWHRMMKTAQGIGQRSSCQAELTAEQLT